MKKMASSSGSNKSRMEAHFVNPNEISMNKSVGESRSCVSKENKGKSKRRAYVKKGKLKVKCPRPPCKPKSTSTSQVSRLSLSLDMAIEYELIHGRQLNPNLDIKAVRRTISNRISAQRSRMKRMQHVIDLEKKVQELEEAVSSLTPKLEDYNEKKRILEIENVSLRTQVDIRAAEARISEDRLEEKRRELMELRKWRQPSSSNFDSEARMQVSQLEMNAPEVDEMQVSQLYMNIVPEFEMQFPGEVEMQFPAEVEMEVPEVEMMVVSPSDEKARPKPYSIEFYQERLMQMEMNQFINQELKNLAPALPPPHPDDDFLMDLAIEDDDDLEIDQYLNLDEIGLLHPNGF